MASWDVTRTDVPPPPPDTVLAVFDEYGDDDGDSSQWGRTHSGEWKGYKNGGKVYLEWRELVRRWGPVRDAR